MTRQVVLMVRTPGLPLAVDIEGASAYAAASGGSAISFPETITATKAYYLDRDSRKSVTVSVKNTSVELAMPRRKVKQVLLDQKRTVEIVPHWEDATVAAGYQAFIAGLAQGATKALTAVRKTASYTAAMSDAGGVVEMNVGSANNFTIPLNASVPFPIGTVLRVLQYGAGVTTIVATSLTVRKTAATLVMSAQYGEVTARKIGADEWLIKGDLN